MRGSRRWPSPSSIRSTVEAAREGGPIDELLRTLAGLPPGLLYVAIGIGAALENVVPPIPADTFVLFGAFLAAAGRADPGIVFLATWLPNVATSILVYGVARRYGPTVFESGVGRWLLEPGQLDQIGRFYVRWGAPAIFISRFLPAFRAMVPIFAGISRVPLRRILLPLAGASAVWYGALVLVGTAAGRHWEAILAAFGRVHGVLLAIAVGFFALFLLWWFRSRRRRE